ncbi:hypothetical protein [uncultured Acetobacteroides sp.]|uniref:hypothetical protein n=1 Tax=uncultured Acetobacteroides sp. TaxID=1760811 RepID=UPI0029F53DBB|nr:hypothetical protein [uncultured Acetobacteroides sp.]
MEERNIETMELSGRTLKELWLAAKWAKLLSIIIVCLYFVMIILVIFSGIITSLFATMIPFGGFFIALVYIITYTLTALIPGIMLYNFAINTQKAILRNDDDLATTGVKRLRQLFQYSGILAMISILLVGLIIAVSVLRTIF